MKRWRGTTWALLIVAAFIIFELATGAGTAIRLCAHATGASKPACTDGIKAGVTVALLVVLVVLAVAWLIGRRREATPTAAEHTPGSPTGPPSR